ncbi:unnamed protein product [Mytilus coruscus]|uniref:Uncharacterized protein n=1 Tax=Mytilus coruscus TaxID=42192 RepID=A0A6J8A906_MYTCO|nr:unnamed protein product [Mytilus coruscus]
MEKLLGEKKKKTEKLKSTADTLEKDAILFVDKTKWRLDDMLGDFIKQNCIIQIDSKLRADIQFLKDFIRTSEHWIGVTEVVKIFGTETQFFIYSKTMTSQIKESITQLATDVDINLTFNKNKGRELFCHKSALLKTPECLTVTPSGIVVVVDRAGSGSSYALSTDGKESKLLLGKFDEIKKPPMDVWTDDRGETICDCRDQYIEVYMTDSEK